MFRAILLLLGLGATSSAFGDGLRPGSYEIDVTLEMPHLERYGVPNTVVVCLKPGQSPPIQSGNGVFEDCEATFAEVGPEFGWSHACPGAAGARATSRYRGTPEGFTGRVSVKLGAKNMTLTELQVARRLGDCAAD